MCVLKEPAHGKQVAAVGDHEGFITLCNDRTVLCEPFAAHGARVTSLCFRSIGADNYVISGSEDGTVAVSYVPFLR